MHFDAGLSFNTGNVYSDYEYNRYGVFDAASDLSRSAFDFADQTLDSSFKLAGTAVDGVFDLAGRTINGSLGLLRSGNSSLDFSGSWGNGNGSYSSEPPVSSGGNGASGQRNLFHSLGELCYSLRDTLDDARRNWNVYNYNPYQSYYYDSFSFYGPSFYGPSFSGHGYHRDYLCPSMISDTADYTAYYAARTIASPIYNPNFSMSPYSTGGMYPSGMLYQNIINPNVTYLGMTPPQMMQPSPQYYRPVTGFDSMFSNYYPSNYYDFNQNNRGNDLISLDEMLYPEKYERSSADRRSDSDKGAQDKQNLRTIDPQGKDNTPKWVRKLQDKKKKGQSLTANEQRLLDSANNLHRKFSIYEYENGEIVTDDAGNPKTTTLAADIQEFENILKTGNNAEIKRKLKSYPKEQLAAMEYWFNQVTGKNMRAAIKDATAIGSSWGMGGFFSAFYNPDDALELFNLLDEAAAENPEYMAASLNQALNNHRIWGFGVDDDRVASLLSRVKDNREFMEALEESYSAQTGHILRNDISKKWFISDKNKTIINSAFK